MKLQAAHQDLLTQAVVKAEAQTAAELVLVVRPRSGDYVDVDALAALALALAALAAALFAPWDVEPELVLPIVVAAALAGGVLGRLLPRRLTTTQARRRRQVDDQALVEFMRAGVHKTTGRTGILVYVSQREGEARVVGDVGVVAAVPAHVRDDWSAQVAAAATGEALAACVEAIGARAGEFLPRRDDDVDELANAPVGAIGASA